jgi:hypothetical protein
MTPQEYQAAFQKLTQAHNDALAAAQKAYADAMQKANADYQAGMLALQAEINKPPAPCPAPAPAPAVKSARKKEKKCN